MLPFWLTVTFLGPVIGCAMFTLLAVNPTPLTAAAGAIVGMVVSLVVMMFFN